jgi:hypothetical protein
MAAEIWVSCLRSGENGDLLSICDHNVRDVTGLASIFLAMGEIAAEPYKSGDRFHFDEEALALFWLKAVKRNPLLYRGCGKTGKLLLERAAGNGCPRAALAMAIEAEWRLKDPELALFYTGAALAASELPLNIKDDLEKRRARLEEKIRKLNSPGKTGSSAL